MREKARRLGWLALAVLFVVTGLGVGVYAFWVNTHPSSNSNVISCAKGGAVPAQKPGSSGKLFGAKLANFNPPVKVSYIHCTDYKVGSGAMVQSSSTVSVQYVGALAADGFIFDSSFDRSQPFTTTLDQVIAGWGVGMQGMQPGGIRRIFIPAQYGYGVQGSPPLIPANSDLVFDVQLLSVK